MRLLHLVSRPVATRSVTEQLPRIAVPSAWLRANAQSLAALAFVACFTLLEVAAAVYVARDVQSFIKIGRSFVMRSNASPAIAASVQYAVNDQGYDGQFYYDVAVDPLGAGAYLDSPSYRYERIGYPMIARVLAAGRSALVPYTLLAINVAAIVAGAILLAVWLAQRGLSPLWSLTYGLYPGLHVALQRDLAEPLAYLLVIAGVLAGESKLRTRWLWSGLLFAVAVLTREVTVLFALLYGSVLLWNNRRTGLLHLSVSLLPFVAWKLFLIGVFGIGGNYLPTPLPFAGAAAAFPTAHDQVSQVAGVIVPGLIICGAAGWALFRGRWSPEMVLVIVNVLVLIVFLNGSSYAEYVASGRVTLGVVTAAMLCLPRLREIDERLLLVAAFSAVLWLTPWLLVPFYAQLGLLVILIALAMFVLGCIGGARHGSVGVV